jgi:hypothetical protein
MSKIAAALLAAGIALAALAGVAHSAATRPGGQKLPTSSAVMYHSGKISTLADSSNPDVMFHS